MTTSEKVAYLKGLCEGMGIGEDSKEGKLFKVITDILEDLSLDMEDTRDAVEELIDVQKGKGEGGFFPNSFAQPGTPGEVAPQLLVAEGLIGGKVADNAAVEFEIVLVFRQELSLFDKDGVPGLPVLRIASLQRSGGFQQRRQRRGCLCGSEDPLFTKYVFIQPLGCGFIPVGIHGCRTPLARMFAYIILYFRKTVNPAEEK